MAEPVEQSAGVATAQVEVHAAKLAWQAGGYVAEGGVQIWFGEDHVTAARAEGGADVLVLTQGTWVHDGSSLAFDSATIQIRSRDAVVRGATLTVGEATLIANSIAVEQGNVLANQATLTPCACDDGKPPAVQFTARHIDVIEAKVAVVRGGVVRVFTVPVLPVPYWRVPLDPDVFRLSIPEIAYGDLGVSTRWHGTWGVAGYRFDAGPAWRQDRGGRLELGVTGHDRLSGEVGWDDGTQSVRGAVATDGGFAGAWAPGLRLPRNGALRDRAAWDISVLSDPEYAEDYGVSYVDRGVLFRESRVLGQLGPLRLAGWLPDIDPVGGTVAEATFRPRLGTAAVSVIPQLGLALVGSEKLESRIVAGAAARGSHSWGGLHLEGTGEVLGQADPADLGAPAIISVAQGRAELATWGDGPLGRFALFPGVVGRAGLIRDEGGASSNDVGVGPSVRVQSALGSTIASLSAAVVFDGVGLAPEGAIDLAGEHVTMRSTVGPDAQAIDLRAGNAVVGRVGVVHAGIEWFTLGEISLHLGRFVSGLGLSIDPVPDAADVRVFEWAGAALALDGATARVGYDDGCSSFVVTAALSPDRDLPDLGAQVVLRK